ncbi:MAG: hypothetical protein LUF78_10770 [Clostridiales bacterium]|nr:hypothetical protein [Clostridiales bacterium]
MKIRTYSELLTFPTFEERYDYLKLNGTVGSSTFGFERFMNQDFYRSKEWKDLRTHVILRDNGCDLGVAGHDIYGPIYIHHLNPISQDDIRHNSDYLLNPEYLITTTFRTHNAIHYGNENQIPKDPIMRTPNDTCPWKENTNAVKNFY